MTELPPGIEPGMEIEVNWERDDLGVKITATLGEASFTVEASYEAAEDMIPWLLAAAPTILEAAWAAIESHEEEDEDPEHG